MFWAMVSSLALTILMYELTALCTSVGILLEAFENCWASLAISPAIFVAFRAADARPPAIQQSARTKPSFLHAFSFEIVSLMVLACFVDCGVGFANRR